MVKLYYQLIKRGLKTIDQVPIEFQEEVKALIEQDNS